MHAEKLNSGAECKQHQAWHFEGVQRDYLCNRPTHIATMGYNELSDRRENKSGGAAQASWHTPSR